jgi:hypothetical protein
VNDNTHPEPRRLRFRRARRRDEEAAAVERLAASTERLAMAEWSRREVWRDPTPEAVAPQEETEPVKTWTGGKVLAVLVISVLTLAATLTMALVAISVQTGFFLASLPPELQNVSLLLLNADIPTYKFAPLALEAGAWLLTAMVVVLVICRRPYRRWHRAMWYIGVTVALINGWHTAALAHSPSIGVSFGAFSILGPMLVHLFVMFVRQLVHGVDVLEAFGETAGGLVRAVRFAVDVVVGLLRILVSLAFHPTAVVRFLSIWSASPQLSPRDAWLSATAVWRSREHYRLTTIAGRTNRGEAPGRKMGSPWWRKSDPAPADTALIGTVPHAAVTSHDTVMWASSIRPETSLPLVDSGQPRGDTLVANDDPHGDQHLADDTHDEHAHGDTVERASVRDDGASRTAKPLDIDEALAFVTTLNHEPDFVAELTELAERVGVRPHDGGSHGADEERAKDRATGNSEDVAVAEQRARIRQQLYLLAGRARNALAVEGVAEFEQQRARWVIAGVEAYLTDLSDGVPVSQGQVDELAAVQRFRMPSHGGSHGGTVPAGASHAPHGERAEPTVRNRASDGEAPSGSEVEADDTAAGADPRTESHDGPHGLDGAHDGPHDDPHDRPHESDESMMETTGSRILSKDLVIREYWTRVHKGQNVDSDAVNFAEIGSTLGVHRSTVSRHWSECLAGQHPDPIGTAEQPRTA